MKIVEPKFKIVQMPDGEEALRIIEQMGRIAYKSEDKIDDGRVRCEGCDIMAEARGGNREGIRCAACEGTGWLQVREPSSHRFVRMILQAERKAKMILMANATVYEEVHGLYDRENSLVPDRVNEFSEQLVNNIIDYMRQNPAHESVIEHCSASVKFTSNRGFTHEIVRHRLASFTQESTRYCDYDKGKFGSQISVINRTFWAPWAKDGMLGTQYDKMMKAVSIWKQAMVSAEQYYKDLRELDIPPEVARDVLPQALKADIGISANFREWRHIFALRSSPRAHPDMRQLMAPLHEEFKKRIPIIFDD